MYNAKGSCPTKMDEIGIDNYVQDVIRLVDEGLM
jgi:hypothetical protein